MFEKDVAQEIRAINDMPYGLARSQRAEALAKAVEEDPGKEEHLAWSYSTLVDSYVWGGEPERAFVPFSKEVALWDQRPELFDSVDQMNFLWSFKWMVAGLKNYPTVPAEQITQTMEDMRRRYADAGHGESSALPNTAFGWADHVGTDEAEDLYLEWCASARDDLSNCKVCEPADQAYHLLETDRLEQGIASLEQHLAAIEYGARDSCAGEPGEAFSQIAAAYLRRGARGDRHRAVSMFRRAVRFMDHAQDELPGPKGALVLFLARTRHPEQALRLAERFASVLRLPDTPYDELSALRGVGAAARIIAEDLGQPGLPVRIPGIDASSAAELWAYARARALDLSAQFDARNGTKTQSNKTLKSFTEQAEEGELPMSVLSPGSTGPGGPIAATGGSASAMIPEPDAAAPEASRTEDPEQLIRDAERAAADSDFDTAVSRYRAAASIYQNEGRISEAGFALAEAAVQAVAAEDHPGADKLFGRSVALLEAADVDVLYRTPVIRAWLATLVELRGFDHANVLIQELSSDLTRAATEDMSELSEDLARQRTAQITRSLIDADDAAARVALSAGDFGGARRKADQAARDFAEIQQMADASFAFWLAGQACVLGNDLGDAVWYLESAVEGFTHLHLKEPRSLAASDLIQTLKKLGRDDDALRVQK